MFPGPLALASPASSTCLNRFALVRRRRKRLRAATLVVSDVKNELIELTGDELARRGYNVLLLDTQRPYRGQRFNPLKQVIDLHAESRDQEAEQAADTIAELVVQDDENGKGSHWTASARGLLSALVLLVSMSDECPKEAKHLATVCEVLDRGTEQRVTTRPSHSRAFSAPYQADTPLKTEPRSSSPRAATSSEASSRRSRWRCARSRRPQSHG